jgi:arylsulfatase A
VVGYALPDDAAFDSFDMLPALLGKAREPIRPHMLTQSFRGEFQLRVGQWKYLAHKGSGGNNYTRGNMAKFALPETEPDATGQLFNLAEDPGETKNLFFKEAAKREEMQALLKQLSRKDGGRTAPRGRRPIGFVKASVGRLK